MIMDSIQNIVSLSGILGLMGTFYILGSQAFGRELPKRWGKVSTNHLIALLAAVQMPIVLIIGCVIKGNS